MFSLLPSIDSDDGEKPQAKIVLKMERKSFLKSIFLKPGELLKEYRDDPLYDMKNFEFLMLGREYHILGSGAFSDVYLTRNKKDGKYYAIKRIEIAKVIQSGGCRELIIREISIHRRLIHNNIVRLFSHYEDKNAFYLIMDYIGKGTLYQLIQLNNGLDERTAFKYFIQVASAVHFLHENNLIHRDLKPENMLIDTDGNLFLCDFGWCTEVKKGNRVTFCGTFEYMAPELIKELPYNQAVDVWSLGVLLYELLHGCSPYRADEEMTDSKSEYAEIFVKILKNRPAIDKKVSEKCCDILTRLLTLDKEKRIKLTDVFTHPWVVQFENEQKRPKEANPKFNDNATVNKDPIVSTLTNDNQNIEDSELNLIRENINKKNFFKLDQSEYKTLFKNQEIHKKEISIDDNVNVNVNDNDKKEDAPSRTKSKSMSNSAHMPKISIEYSNPSKLQDYNAKIKVLSEIENISDHDKNNNSLFNKVLTQVSKKKKDKRHKKSTEQVDSVNMFKNPGEKVKIAPYLGTDLYSTQASTKKPKCSLLTQLPLKQSEEPRGSVILKGYPPGTFKPNQAELDNTTTGSTDDPSHNINSNNHIHCPIKLSNATAVDMLDRAKKDNVIYHPEPPEKEESFWDKVGELLNPFMKCKGK